ncbi:MAG TPA: FkbM family methyltransferase [archaeon]|nr:FkbM family methyltransferase [archaeon]
MKVLDRLLDKFKIAISVLKDVENPIDYFLRRESVIRVRNKFKVSIRNEEFDRVTLNNIYFRKLFTPDGFQVREGDIVLDVGATIGVFPLMVAKNCEKVYAFEPCRTHFSMLQKNIALNKFHNIIPLDFALSDKTGKEDFFISKSSAAHSLFRELAGEVSSVETVNTISLEDFMRRFNVPKIDLLKMNCEGGEYKILMKSRVLDKIDKISTEYHDKDDELNGLALRKFLESKGFSTLLVKRARTGMIYARRI